MRCRSPLFAEDLVVRPVDAAVCAKAPQVARACSENQAEKHRWWCPALFSLDANLRLLESQGLVFNQYPCAVTSFRDRPAGGWGLVQKHIRSFDMCFTRTAENC